MQEYKIGTRVTGKCVTMFTEHTGPVISCVPSAFYSDGTPREYRTTIRSEATGRPVILWTGTECEARPFLRFQGWTE